MLFGKSRHNRIITGLDIGTTKVCVIIGEVGDDGHINVLGMGTCPSKGLRCGEIIDVQPTVNAIAQATRRAVEVANVQIDELYVGIAGEHIRSKNTSAMVEIRHPARGIDEKDRRRAVEKAEHNVAIPEDLALIHRVIQEFRVNGGNPTANPIGLSGSNLEVSAHMVMSGADAVRNIIRCVKRAGLPQPTIVLQSLASSMSVITPTERELGTCLVDIGGGTTDVAISVAGAIRYTTEVPIGGDHITRDVAQILNCSMADAENAKKRYGCALPQMVERGRTFELPSAGDSHDLIRHEEYLLAEVIEARLEDIFTIIREKIERAGYGDHLHGGVVLTGGTSLLQGITDVAERLLETKCRRGQPRNLKGLTTVVGSPIYATGIGLILYGAEGEQMEGNPRYTSAMGGSLGGMRRLFHYFLENFI